MRAVILAHEGGRSLRPLSFCESPVMASIAGTPLLEIWVRKLVRAGFDEIVVATGRFGESIEAVFGEGNRFGARIAYAFQGRVNGGALEPFEQRPRETFGRIHSQTGFCSQTTLLLRPTGAANLDIREMLAHHRASGAARTVARFEGLPPNQGLHVSLLEPDAASSLPDDLAECSPRQEYPVDRAHALETVGDYLDLSTAALGGYVEDWIQPGVEIADGVRAGVNVRVDLSRVEASGPVYLGGGAVIRPGAKLVGPVWVGGCAVLDSDVTLRHSVVGRYSRLAAGLELDDCVVNGDQIVNRFGETRLMEPVGPAWSVEDDRSDQRHEAGEASMPLELRRLAGRASGLWSSEPSDRSK